MLHRLGRLVVLTHGGQRARQAIVAFAPRGVARDRPARIQGSLVEAAKLEQSGRAVRKDLGIGRVQDERARVAIQGRYVALVVVVGVSLQPVLLYPFLFPRLSASSNERLVRTLSSLGLYGMSGGTSNH